MSSRRRFPVIFTVPAALLFIMGPSGIVADEPAAKGARDEWHKIYLLGKPAGFMHLTVRPREGGGFVVISVQKLALKRGLVPIETEGSSSVEEGADGRIKSFRMMQKMSKDAMETVGALEGDSLAVTDTVGGQNPRKSKIALDPEAVGSFRAEEIVKEKLKKPGDSAEVTVFIPELRKFGKQKAIFEREEEVELETKKKATLRRFTMTVDALPGITTVQWYDEKDDMQKSSIALLGMEMITYRSSAADVLKENFSSPPEIFFNASIPVNRKVRGDAKEVTYRFTSSGSFPSKPGAHLFPGAGHQIVREEGPSVRVLRVQRVRPKESVSLPLATTPGLEEYLRPSSFIQSDDKDIAEVAKKVAGLEHDAWKTATTLEHWTYTNIRDKNMDTAFATAKEVMTTKSGDCTEHAVLLAALLRAAGVPSRVVAGVVYYDGAFVGHMWTEAYVGEWVPLDATRGKGEVGPDHIALSVSSLDSSSIADVFLDIVSIIGNVKVEVLESVD